MTTDVLVAHVPAVSHFPKHAYQVISPPPTFFGHSACILGIDIVKGKGVESSPKSNGYRQTTAFSSKSEQME